MRVLGVRWVGTRTEHASAMVDLLSRVLGLAVTDRTEHATLFEAANGDMFEVFGPGSPREHFTGGPVVGFEVDDLGSAVAELAAAGVELLEGGMRFGDGSGWQHFRAPDGNVYELTARPSTT